MNQTIGCYREDIQVPYNEDNFSAVPFYGILTEQLNNVFDSDTILFISLL